MTQAEALKNVMDTLTSYRALSGLPSEIDVECGEKLIRIVRGWSKSATHNNTRPVFIIADNGNEYPDLALAARVYYGKSIFIVTTEGIRDPETTGGYWQLPVTEA